MSSTGYLSAEELLTRVAPLVDGRTGLIGPTSEVYLEPGNPEIIVYSSMLSDLTQALPHITLKNEDGLPMAGSGSSTTRDYAQAKALCEGLERYCNISFDPASVITASRDELGDEAIDLDPLRLRPRRGICRSVHHPDPRPSRPANALGAGLFADAGAAVVPAVLHRLHQLAL